MEKLMGDFKHRKLCKKQHDSEDEDKISNLPDCVLHHILSFLPTKDAVGTCILSTRWKYLWTSVTNFDFDDSLLYLSRGNCWYPLEVTHFMNFVERVLLLRDGSNMKKFRLSCRVCFNASRINAWISAAIKHKAQELDLCLFVESTFMLPRSVFYGELLRVVKIEMNCALRMPDCISFPCLKTLHLSLVTFIDDLSTQKLFSSCPVLENLAILDCEWMNLKGITLSIPTMKSLVIDDLPYFGSADEIGGCVITVDAPNLMFLEYSGYLLNEVFIYDIPSLDKASIHIPLPYDKQEEFARRAVEFLRSLKCAKSIRISNGTVKVLDSYRKFLWASLFLFLHLLTVLFSLFCSKSLFLAGNALDNLPMFKNLTHLELSMEIDLTFQALIELLECSPNLESLVLSEGFNPLIWLCEDDCHFSQVPKCFFSCLKSVGLHNFHGHDIEICFLSFLLENAHILEQLNIFGSKNPLGDLGRQKDIRNQLQLLARIPRSCTVTFL